MNAKAKTKSNLMKIGALVLAGIIIIGMLAGLGQGQATTSTGFDYSAGLTKEGFFEGVTAGDYVTLPDYKAYTIPEDLTIATEDEIEAQIRTIQENFTTQEADADTTRAIVDGDTVNIDYVGSIDGVEFEGGSTGGSGTDVTIGVTEYIDDFLQQLIGHKPGENFDIEVTFPEDYGNEELNGKDAVFNITINHFYKYNVPEITDEFVKENLGNYYETVEEMRADVTERIVDDRTKNYVWAKLIEESEISEHPESVVAYEEAYAIEYLNQTASQYGMTAEDFITMYGYASQEEYLSEIKEDTLETVKLYMVVQAICEAEGYKVEDRDIKEYFQKYYGTDDYSTFQDVYGKPYLKFCVIREVMLENIIADMEVVPATAE